MNVKRFFAPTAREALRQVKESLGADAIVLSNRTVDDGIEILALPPEAVASLTAKAAPQPSSRAAPGPVAEDDFQVSLSSAAAKRFQPGIEPQPWRPQQAEAPKRVAPARAPEAPKRAVEPPALRPARGGSVAARYLDEDTLPEADQAARLRETFASRNDSQREAPKHDEQAMATAQASAQMMAELTTQMAQMRAMLESQLAGFAWGEMARNAPARTQMMSELLEAGFSAQLARELMGQVPDGATTAEARTAVREALSRGLSLLNSDADIIDRGGIYAIVGPTGVGKTTTTAKLAARCVVRHGAENLALITTDSYRIGAHEQLRIYGRILGVPVHAVRDAADLRATLRDLGRKHMVLIDTVGMGQRDKAVAEQAAMLHAAGDVRRLLLLNATARGDTLDDVVRAYNGPDLAGCVFTKVDEAVSLAPVLDVAVRNELDVFYVANGQRVPEDLHVPNRAYLLHRALKEVPDNSPHRLYGDEAGMLLAAQPRAASIASDTEVRHG